MSLFRIKFDTFTSREWLRHIKNYRDYVENNDVDEINVFESKKYTALFIGSELFEERVLSQVDQPILRNCLSDINHIKTIPTIDTIIDHVARYYDVKHDELLYAKRNTLNWPRLV